MRPEGGDHRLPYLANCSLLWAELPLTERPAAARAAGFDAIELWWPWPDPVPPAADVDALVDAVGEAGVQLVALNLFSGDLAGPDSGVLSVPGREREFLDNLPVAADIARRLGVSGFNAPYGNRIDGVDPAEQDELAVVNLLAAAKELDAVGGTVLVEPMSGPKPNPIRLAADAAAVVERARTAGAANVAVLCDLYHLATNGDDLDAVVERVDQFAHVQIADAPGRGQPGTGRLDLTRHLRALEAAGYDGWVSLEYKPVGTTLESLAWLPVPRRAAGPVLPRIRYAGGAA